MPVARDVKHFVPSIDFDTSLAFYRALGWNMNWRADKLAELEIGNVRFLLQDFYAKEWAENSMVYIVVESASDWFEHASRVIDDGNFDAARVAAPTEEAHAVVTYVWDPCGVLLHFAEARG